MFNNKKLSTLKGTPILHMQNKCPTKYYTKTIKIIMHESDPNKQEIGVYSFDQENKFNID